VPTDPSQKEASMPVVDRAALEDSPLADLHALASELGIDGFRRLRKAQLVDAILERQGGGDGATAAAPEAAEEEAEAEERPRRSRRGGRSRRKDADEAPAAEEKEQDKPEKP